MATPLQSAVPDTFILSAKPQVQIETSSGGVTSTTTNRPPSKQKSMKTLNKSSSRSSLDSSSAKGTVLLRQPLPKYSFQVTKKSAGKKTATAEPVQSEQQSSGLKSSTSNVDYTANPIPVSMAMPQFIQSSTSNLSSSAVPNSDCVQTLPARQKPVSKVDPVQSTKLQFTANPLNTSLVSITANKSDSNLQKPAVLNETYGNVMGLPSESHQTAAPDNAINSVYPQPLGKSLSTSIESLPFPELTAGGADSQTASGSVVHSTDNANWYKAEADRLKVEVSKLQKQLEVQFQVNAELKKLLIASVGDDLQFRVENLARDRAQLSSEIGSFAKKRSEDYEHIDKISIQADMWRSKFLASRVMVDELAGAKAFLAMQCQESQSALQEMLTERHELRSNLLETYKTMQQVKSAFDPLNAQKTFSLPSTNSLDLARMNQRLAEQIRYRLLPSHVALDTVVNMDSWIDNLTLAESRAHEFLSKKINPDDVRHHIPSSLRDPGDNIIDRFHPYTRFDNLTLNCCVRCQGEMFAL